jgi:hypothetical protein
MDCPSRVSFGRIKEVRPVGDSGTTLESIVAGTTGSEQGKWNQGSPIEIFPTPSSLNIECPHD